jgi:hypothetical protein
MHRTRQDPFFEKAKKGKNFFDNCVTRGSRAFGVRCTPTDKAAVRYPFCSKGFERGYRGKLS